MKKMSKTATTTLASELQKMNGGERSYKDERFWETIF